jgi:hypothetical protein
MRRIKIKCNKDISAMREMSMKSPIVVRAIPADATILGSTLSESWPAIGEIIAWTTG